ncbi:TcpE family conjugal transfer membrane protein [Enterococcus gallinarum]|uniref:TcpE family conjugal transfer membrane protein n=1 Tax=Enterococcus gallinarum TaxID=1353 RepID=UPI001DCC8F99|nr:TcpE family conjugal transfer membrane protein [Enterococcus gallinarum]MDT2681269.1 TcpE family conjugal transfer membrane protein [Enterococcus gallinarum]HJE18411.1 conjugal transfer protein [Enterococcus casseliflavus]
MEYNYTREFKQPIKIYSIKGHAIPLAPNGIRFEHIVVGGVFLFLALLIWLLGFIANVSFIQSLFTNHWLIIIAGVGVLVWTLFSLKWDNKNFLDYILGRGSYVLQKKKRYEHELFVPFFHEKVIYQIKRKQRK